MKKRERYREFSVGERVVVNARAPGGYIARLGTVLEIVLGSRYGLSSTTKRSKLSIWTPSALTPFLKYAVRLTGAELIRAA
jgi:hypothetical protein